MVLNVKEEVTQFGLNVIYAASDLHTCAFIAIPKSLIALAWFLKFHSLDMSN